ncbi:hypothetical protein KSP39_PZI008667 [Platanthera zijinensis]|uniref:Sec-independent protein translocase protein TATB, chloroplastic n=1 Tax=Platanthera zijinensis TaxID=2320716 RepID=A0AAP0G8K8_9ASPA
MAAALLGVTAPCCCFRLMPVRYLSPPFTDLNSKNQGSHTHGASLHSGLRVLSPSRGLKHLGLPFPGNRNKLGKKRKSGCMVAYASLFGVGAPEALVIGVVALLIFGPKGLAEVARNLGKTLRAFQPTVRELQEVSREFKSTLEREIGLDDITSSSNNTYRSNPFFKENQDTTEPDVKPTAEPIPAATANNDQTDLPEGQPQDGGPTAESPPAATTIMVQTDSSEEPQAEITSQTENPPSPSLEVSKTSSAEVKSHTPT